MVGLGERMPRHEGLRWQDDEGKGQHQGQDDDDEDVRAVLLPHGDLCVTWWSEWIG